MTHILDGKTHSRRSFLTTASLGVGSVVVAATRVVGQAQPKQQVMKTSAAASSDNSFKGTLCFFSKHLPDMDGQRLAQSVKRIGFGGVDLTVRPGGHVLPERVAEDLPKFAQAIRSQGVELPLITTTLLSATDPTARPILSTAGKLKIPFFKPGYYNYKYQDVRAELEHTGNEFRRLSQLAKEQGVQTGFHNHANNLGGPVWDIARVIDTLDPASVGYYFDIRHAVVEGGGAGWKIAANLVAPRLKMIAIKDFYWEKTASKGWQVRNCPLGEGMVDWKNYFQVLARAGFRGPVSLHVEYDVPGATRQAQEDNMLVATERDFKFMKTKLDEAYATSAAQAKS